MRRFHDIVIRPISGQYLIEVRDATTGNRLAEAIVPTLDDVKRFMDNSLKEDSINAVEEGQQQTDDKVEH